MRPKEQADLLGIFAFVFAGIQSLAVLFFGLYILFMAAMAILAATDSRNTDASVYIVPAVIIVLFGLMCAIGLTTIIRNIKMGRSLRSNRLPTQRSIVITSIFNICSFFCGGVLVLPFGMALGVFGLIFALSDTGKAFLAGIPDAQVLVPPSPQVYSNRIQNEPYKWQ